jgi:hypothetical protein
MGQNFRFIAQIQCEFAIQAIQDQSLGFRLLSQW